MQWELYGGFRQSGIVFSISNKGIPILIYIVADMERILRLMERGKDKEAPATLKGVLGTASPSGAVHVGPTVASGVGRPHINSPSNLIRCDKVILAILLHTAFCTVLFQDPMGAFENVEQVTFEVQY